MENIILSHTTKPTNNDLNKLSKPPYSIVSLFSGCGGMDLGFKGGFNFLGKEFEALPFDIVWANDLNAAACRSYAKNLKHPILQGNIWDHINSLPKSADIVIGGFPCQDISVNGKGAGVAGSRSGLYRAMVEVVRKTKPKVFIAENVKGLLMKHNKASLKQIIDDFTSLGYNLSYKLYHAVEYGVPQTRERVMIVGTKPGVKKFEHPAAIYPPEMWITAEQALKDLEKLPSNSNFSHIWSLAKKSPEQGSRMLKANRAGYTVRAECHGNIHFHYKLSRRMSMREAARIQSFPDSFIFDAKLRETERQIGNAVPPVLAWHIAKATMSCLQN